VRWLHPPATVTRSAQAGTARSDYRTGLPAGSPILRVRSRCRCGNAPRVAEASHLGRHLRTPELFSRSRRADSAAGAGPPRCRCRPGRSRELRALSDAGGLGCRSGARARTRGGHGHGLGAWDLGVFAGSLSIATRAPATMNEGLAEAPAANPFRLPRNPQTEWVPRRLSLYVSWPRHRLGSASCTPRTPR
jgi:hypothetical protein